MELTHLRYFAHVAETQSFSRGAALSHVSPPAVSKVIKHLEDELGTQLFERTTRSVVLTEAGRILLARCHSIFDEVDGIRRDLDDAQSKVAGLVRIAAMEVFSVYLLPVAIAALVRQHPSVTPHSYEMLPDDMARHVADGRLDVGFTIGAKPRAGVTITQLGTSRGVVVCGRSHPLYRAKRLRKSDVSQFSFVVPRFFQREALPSLDQFDDERWPRAVGATMELLQLGIELCVAGAYLGYFPEITLRQHVASGSLWALRGAPPGPAFELQMLTRSGGPLRPVVKALAEEVSRVLERTTKSVRSGSNT